MKKLIILLTLCSVSFIASAQSTKRATGDVNGDGIVDVADVTTLVQQILTNQFEYINVFDGHTITVTSNNTEYGTVSGGGIVAAEQSVTLTAIANSGYKFDGWYKEDNLLSSSTTYTFTPIADMQIVGKFSKQQDPENPTGTTDPFEEE